MIALSFLLGFLAALFSQIEACPDPNGFHCPTNGDAGIWNCPLSFKRTIDRWRCIDHCCWCRDEGTMFRRLCTVADLAVISEQQPILVNPNFNCNHCNQGAICAYQENVRRQDGRGFIGPPENGCSLGRRVSNPQPARPQRPFNRPQGNPVRAGRFNPFARNRSFPRGKREIVHVDLMGEGYEYRSDVYGPISYDIEKMI